MNINDFNLDNLSLTRGEIRDALGLNPTFKDYVWPALGLVSAGLALGAGAALLLAPKSGKQLRTDLSNDFRDRLDTIEARLRELTQRDEDSDADTDIEVETKAA